MRKIISLSLCLLLCVFTLSGCSKKGSEFVGTWRDTFYDKYPDVNPKYVPLLTLNTDGSAEWGAADKNTYEYTEAGTKGTWSILNEKDIRVELKAVKTGAEFILECRLTDGELQCDEIYEYDGALKHHSAIYKRVK